VGFNPIKFVVGVGGFVAGAFTGQWWLAAAGLGMALSADEGQKPADVKTDLRKRQAGTIAGNDATEGTPIPVVYGSVKRGVTLNELRVPDTASLKDLYICGVLCHGSRDGEGIASIDDIYFDDRPALLSLATHVTPFTATHVTMVKMLGTDSQNWGTAQIDGTSLSTNFTQWDSTDAGKDVAGILLKLTYDPDVYMRGLPVITAKLKGNFVEDHRDETTADSTNTATFTASNDRIALVSTVLTNGGWTANDRVAITGSVSNNAIWTVSSVATNHIEVTGALDDEAAASNVTLKRWAHPDNTGGTNPALCTRDYLLSDIFGVGMAGDDIDETSFDAAADYCDETVTNPTTATQTRHTANGWLDTGRSIEQCIRELLSACRGNLVYEGGVFRLFITQDGTATAFELDEDNIIGDWEIRNPGTGSKINKTLATYIDPNELFSPIEVHWPRPGESNPYLTSDNNFENRLTVDLPFTNDPYMAEEIIMTRLKESRNGIVVSLRATEEALKLQIGDIVPVTHSTPGWTDKEFWVMGMAIRPDATVDMLLTEYVSTAYVYTTATAMLALVSNPMFETDTVTAPTTLVLTAGTNQALTMGDGTYIPRIKVEFTDSTDRFLDGYDIEAKQTGEDWDSWGPMALSADSFMISPVVEGANWDVQVRAFNTMGVRSTWISTNVTPVFNPNVTETTNIDGFSASQNATAPENGTVVLSADGAFAYSNLEGANTRACAYTCNYSLDSTSMSSNNFCFVRLYVNDAAGSTDWTEVDFNSYDDSQNGADTLSYAGPMGENHDFRMGLSYESSPGGDTATLTVSGEDSSPAGVVFKKVT